MSSKARALDVLEPLALVAVPATCVGALAFLVGGSDAFALGALVGGVFGGILAEVRRTYRAVATEEGIERERRPVHTDERNPWVRLAAVEYDRRWDRFLAAGAALLSAVAFGYVAFVAENPDPRLLLVSLGGFVVAVLVYGAPDAEAAS